MKKLGLKLLVSVMFVTALCEIFATRSQAEGEFYYVFEPRTLTALVVGDFA